MIAFLSREEATMKAREACWSRKIDFDKLYAKAKQITLFGSWTCNLQTPDSDIDLFCIGSGEAFKDSHLDLIWVPEEQILLRSWLGSELATHIATYGIWIKNFDTWGKWTFISKESITNKMTVLKRKCSMLERQWIALSPSFRNTYSKKLRNEIIRLHCLLNGIAVPPTQLLESFRRATGATIQGIISQLPENQFPKQSTEWLLKVTTSAQSKIPEPDEVESAKKLIKTRAKIGF